MEWENFENIAEEKKHKKDFIPYFAPYLVIKKDNEPWWIGKIVQRNQTEIRHET